MKIEISRLAAALENNQHLSIFNAEHTQEIGFKRATSAMLGELPVKILKLLEDKGISVGRRKGIKYRDAVELQEASAIVSLAGSDEGKLFQDDQLDDVAALDQALRLALVCEDLEELSDERGDELFRSYFAKQA